jgi:hypothetical protein
MQSLMRLVEETTTGAIFTPFIESTFLPDTYPGYLFKSLRARLIENPKENTEIIRSYHIIPVFSPSRRPGFHHSELVLP